MQLITMKRRDGQHGFTLIEMAVVMLVMALLLGGMLLPLSERAKSDRYKTTEQALQEAKEALMGYAISNVRLPCPDTNMNGSENAPCVAGAEGDLPYVTLGIARNDAWNNPLRYRVDPNYAITITNPLPAANGYLVRNLEAAPVTLATDPAAIIFSYGENGLPDDDNNNGNNIYIQDVPSEVPFFDDSLVWLSKNTLMNRLVAAGQWP